MKVKYVRKFSIFLLHKLANLYKVYQKKIKIHMQTT